MAKISKWNIRAEGDKVLLILDGRLVATMPWEAAQEFARGVMAKGKQAEEYAKAPQIITDQALLMRVGAKLGLTKNLRMLGDAKVLAETDKRLRTSIPSIRSSEKVGTPRIVGGKR